MLIIIFEQLPIVSIAFQCLDRELKDNYRIHSHIHYVSLKFVGQDINTMGKFIQLTNKRPPSLSHSKFIFILCYFIYFFFTLGKPLSETLFFRGAQQLHTH